MHEVVTRGNDVVRAETGPPWAGVVLAIVVGVVLSLLVPLLTLATSLVIPSRDTGGVLDAATRYPALLQLLGIMSAAFSEEVLFRSYPLERMRRRGR